MLEYIDLLWSGAGVDEVYRRALYAVLRPDHAENGSAHAGASVLDLPGLCCEAAGGTRRQADGVAAAWLLFYHAAHLLDDIEDGDWIASSPNELGARINIATGLIKSASLALCDLGASVAPEAASTIRRDFHHVILAMCGGQHADLTQFERTLEQCWRIVEAKSGAFFALACRAGACLAASPAEQLQAFSEFGSRLGVLIQIKNDAGGLIAQSVRRSDIASAKHASLPIAYALHVFSANTPQCDRLRECLNAAPQDRVAEEEARRQIIESGALLYLAVEAEQQRKGAETALHRAIPASHAQAQLLALLNRTATGGGV